MGHDEHNKFREITIITTGGTIEKTYDELEGTLENKESTIKNMLLARLRLPYTRLNLFSVLSKDSLFMTEEDRNLLVMFLKGQMGQRPNNPILVLHGTDTMAQTAEYCHEHIKELKAPLIFTGAMRPLGFLDSDAPQNVTEALLAAQLLSPGVYISFHNRIFPLPGVQKNKAKGTFEGIPPHK